MTDRYIIDTNVLLQYPEVLASARGKRLLIPQAVLKELQSARVLAGRSELQGTVAEALRQGVHIAALPGATEIERIASDATAQGLGGADIDIAVLAIEYVKKMGSNKVCVITADRTLAKFLSSKGIQSVTGPQFLSEQVIGKADIGILNSAKKAVSKQKRYLVISLFLGIGASLLGNMAFAHYRLIIDTFPVWGTVIGLPGLGIVLYWYRQHFRFSYGVFEFFVGAIMSYYVFVPSFDYSRLSTATALQVIGGLYVMVRGLDNIGKGTMGSWIESFWRRWFHDVV